jgi:hypothetical protein
MKKNLLLTWREAPKIFGVFISGAKRRKLFEAYLCCNLENCLTPSISVPKNIGKLYIQRLWGGGGRLSVTHWYMLQNKDILVNYKVVFY